MTDCGGLHEWASKRIDELTAENDRLRAREDRLAAATAYLKKVYPEMWACDEALRAFLANQPAATTTLDQDLAAAHPHLFPAAPSCVGRGCPRDGECPEHGRNRPGQCVPAAPTRTEAEHKPVDAFGGCGVATCALCYRARTEAEQAVLDAWAEADSGWLRETLRTSGPVMRKAIRAELARRGLK